MGKMPKTPRTMSAGDIRAHAVRVSERCLITVLDDSGDSRNCQRTQAVTVTCWREDACIESSDSISLGIGLDEHADLFVAENTQGIGRGAVGASWVVSFGVMVLRVPESSRRRMYR
jgi:hypothetical protein